MKLKYKFTLKTILILSFSIININTALAEPIKKIDDENIKYLVINKTNKYVKQLQEFLNSHGFNNSDKGPGSPGNETQYFGSDTKESIKIYQESQGLEITGKIDLDTKDNINEFIKQYDLPKPKKSEILNEYTGVDDNYMNGETIDQYTNDFSDTYKSNIIKDYTLNDSNKNNFEYIEYENNSQNNKVSTYTDNSSSKFISDFFQKIQNKYYTYRSNTK